MKQGSKIPTKKLVAAANKGGTLGRRARLAGTLKGFKHKKSSKNDHDADDKKTSMKKTMKKAAPMKMCKTCGKKHAAGKCMKKGKK